MAAAALFAALATGVCALSPLDAIDLDAGEVRVRDVITLDCIAPERRARMGELIVAQRPSHVRELELDRGALLALVRRRAPGLGEVLTVGASGSIRLRFPSASTARPEPRCFAAARSLGPGHALRAPDLVAGDCANGQPTPLRYDRRHGIVRTARAIEAGELLGPLAPLPGDVVEQGAALTLVSRSGPIVIEREVRAAQAARTGGALFVRDREGRLFSAPFPEADAEHAP